MESSLRIGIHDGIANSSDYVFTTALDIGIDVLRGSSSLKANRYILYLVPIIP
jgi:hypothetical protein